MRRRASRSNLLERPARAFVIAGETLVVRVRESSRAEAMRIIVRSGGSIEVVIPSGASTTHVDAFLEQKRRWVETKVGEALTRAARPRQLGLDRRGVVWVGGRAVPVQRRNGGPSVARLRTDRLLVSGPDLGAAAAVGRWYRREAKDRIRGLASGEARRLGYDFQTISIGDPRTRWGSCSSRGTLSFSWRLLLAPDDVMGYVVAHELCHLRHPHHRRPFWQLLDSAWPSWQDQAFWLREYGHELHEYEPGLALATRA